MKREWPPLVILVAALMLVVAFGVWNSADDALTVALLIGVPLSLAVITKVVVSRLVR